MQTGDYVVHIVDDEEPVRKSLAFLLTMAGFTARVHDFATSFLALAPGLTQGLLVTDLRMPDMNGVELLTKLGDNGAMLPAIVISGHGDVPMAVAAMKAGALDFIEKPVSRENLVQSVARALEMDPARRPARMEEARRQFAGLTTRQREILDRILAGHPNKIIAFDLQLSQRTVENHRAAIMDKTGAKSLPELARLAFTAGWDED